MKRNTVIKYFILALFSLVPLLWFIGKGNVIINGLDTNFPIDPIIWFQRRFYIWNDAYNAGSHFGSSVAGLLFHFIQAAPYFFGLKLQMVEILSILFWSTCIVLSSFTFARTFLSAKTTNQLLFVSLYSFNIYLFNSWENIKVANLALMVGVPLLLSLASKAFHKSLSIKKVIFYSTLIGVLVSGSGINPAYFISLLGSLFIYSLVYLVFNIREVKTVVISLSAICIPLFLVNLFWIVPLFNFLFANSGTASLETIGFTNWVQSLSENTSVLNVLRLQGAWDWYVRDSAGLPIYIPYALRYFYSLPFILFSFAVPLLALFSLVWRRKGIEFIYVFFASMTLVGIFMGVGLHEPTGNLFGFLLKYLPFFSFFRSPWYIFTPYTIIGLGGLSVLFFEKTESHLAQRKFKRIRLTHLLNVGISCFIFLHLIYSYPQITGKIFRPGREDSFYQNFPSYVFDAKQYLASHDTGRIISYEESALESFSWGYKGTESILGLLSSKEVLAPSFNYSNKYFSALMDQFYKHIRRDEVQSALAMSHVLGFQTIFLREDTSSYSKSNHPQVKSFMKATEQFGDWSFLSLPDTAVSPNTFIAEKVYTMNLSPSLYAEVSKVVPSSAIVLDEHDSLLENISEDKGRIGSIVAGIPFAQNKENQLNFTIDIAKPNKYSLVITYDRLATSDLNVFVDNEPISNKEYNVAETTISINDIELSIGKHTITLVLPSIKPTINTQSYILTSDVKSDTRLSIPLPSFDRKKKYILKFKSKFDYGYLPNISAVQSGEDAPFKIENIAINESSEWEETTYLIDPVELPSKFELILSMPKTMNKASKFEIKDISLSPIYDNHIYAIENIPNFTDKASNITYNKINPTFYQINVSNAPNGYFLVNRNLYHPGWVVSSTDYIGGKTLHFSANGYSNAWYIPVGGNYILNLSFQPQKDYAFALKLSISVFIIVVIWGIKDYFQKNDE